MRRLIPILTLAAGALLIAAAFGSARLTLAQDDHGSGGEDEFAAARGAAVFAEFCQACHGPRGEALGTGPAFAAIEYDDESAHTAILKGVKPGTEGGAAMPAYNKLLDQDQVDDLVAYLATWKTDETPALPEPNIRAQVTQVPNYFGDPQAGAIVYAKFCNGCHGPEGKGRQKPGFPAFKFSADTTLQVVREQHVPAFGAAAGGPLSDQQLTDLETYIASWSLTEKKDEPRTAGMNVLIVVMGIGAILTVGAAYMSRMIYTE